MTDDHNHHDAAMSHVYCEGRGYSDAEVKAMSVAEIDDRIQRVLADLSVWLYCRGGRWDETGTATTWAIAALLQGLESRYLEEGAEAGNLAQRGAFARTVLASVQDVLTGEVRELADVEQRSETRDTRDRDTNH